MRCSNCQGHSLEPKELEPGLVSAMCPNCEGTLLSLTNYRYWLEFRDSSPAATEQEFSDDPILVEDSLSARCCPKCSRLMTKYQISANSDNRIDMCSGCDEVWLDKDEWRLLKGLGTVDNLTGIFTNAWQRKIRQDREKANLKAHYEKQLTTEDFSKIDQFKQWLDEHPEKSIIKHYLTINFD